MNSLKNLISLAHEVVPKISCKEFTANQKQFLIIDVREGNEIQETGTIAGALNIPRGLIEMNQIDQAQSLLDEVLKDQPSEEEKTKVHQLLSKINS